MIETALRGSIEKNQERFKKDCEAIMKWRSFLCHLLFKWSEESKLQK